METLHEESVFELFDTESPQLSYPEGHEPGVHVGGCPEHPLDPSSAHFSHEHVLLIIVLGHSHFFMSSPQVPPTSPGSGSVISTHFPPRFPGPPKEYVHVYFCPVVQVCVQEGIPLYAGQVAIPEGQSTCFVSEHDLVVSHFHPATHPGVPQQAPIPPVASLSSGARFSS